MFKLLFVVIIIELCLCCCLSITGIVVNKIFNMSVLKNIYHVYAYICNSCLFSALSWRVATWLVLFCHRLLFVTNSWLILIIDCKIWLEILADSTLYWKTNITNLIHSNYSSNILAHFYLPAFQLLHLLGLIRVTCLKDNLFLYGNIYLFILRKIIDAVVIFIKR